MASVPKAHQAGNACHPYGAAQQDDLKGTKEEIKCFNAYLDNLQTKVYQAHRLLTEAEAVITAETIRNKGI
jgi:hypothetical protein